MREKGSWSEATYTSRASETTTRGVSVTYEGEQRARKGKGLDPLVDPSKYDVVRGSNNLLVPRDDGTFVLEFGAAMPVETDFDTTGSMGGNVEVAFRVLPRVQNLLVQGKNAILRRYHTQIATGVIQDRTDKFPYERSQFEPDNEVDRQMGLLVPEKDGGDAIEDYQIALFALAYLTKTSISKYGLRGYYFPLGDMYGRNGFERNVMESVFGPSVWEKAFGSSAGFELPTVTEAAKKLLQDWHAFFLQVGSSPGTTEWWAQLLGRERVIRLPRTEDVAEVQACIIGLTEGVLDLRSAGEFLREAGMSKERTIATVEAVRGIPVGLQKTFPNFDRIPMAGAVFASRDDIWPIGMKGIDAENAAPSEPKEKAKKKKNKDGWKL
ncbi:MAG: hypothetical protein HZA36_00100 [Parcubacteria group bacterium]|nr:hypothetical protein [Parcubacteria group bacterium]